MARPVEHIAKTLEEALMALNPSHPVHACVDDLDVELRVVGQAKAEIPLGDFMAEGGGWKGESPEEILRILREARAAETSSEPPKL